MMSVEKFRNWTELKTGIRILLPWCLFLFVSIAFSQEMSVLQGTVVDETDLPLPYVNIYVENTFDGTISDENGNFTFQTFATGNAVVIATIMGFEPVREHVVLTAGDTTALQFRCLETLIEFDDVVVTASAYSSGEEEGVTLNSLDVVTTPGAAADVFLAIKTFPGVAMVDEGSGLFVRGGDVSETVTIMDQATLVHPYRYESPTGGEFGTIPPFLLSGTFFSSGGFTAKYGNALSGVMEMNSLNVPGFSHIELGAGLAATSAGYHGRFFDGKLGIRFSGNYSDTEPMFRVNNLMDEFSEAPYGYDGNLSLVYDYSGTGRIKFFNYLNQDRFGVHVNAPSFDGSYDAVETNSLHNLQWREIFGEWLMESSFSVNRFDSERNLGNLDLDNLDITTKFRSDFQRSLYENIRLETGVEWERIENSVKGTAPYYGDVYDPEARVYRFDEEYPASRYAAYVHMESQVSRRWFLGSGVRSDFHDPAEAASVDPRFQVRYQWTRSTNLRASWGLYHQGPSPYQVNDVSGNPDLELQQAQHFVGTWETVLNRGLIRCELYYKPYRNLILPDAETNFNNRGDGESYGLDLFLKHGEFLIDRVHGWISYSYLHSERLQARRFVGDHDQQLYLYETGPSPFDVTHNLTTVVKVRLWQFLSLGTTYRYATGRPHTPIVDAVSPENPEYAGSYYLPVDGEVGSERLPDFHRLDADISWYYPFGNNNALVLYVATSNLLNRANVHGYEYSDDYSERTELTTDYKRFIYFGFSLTLYELW